jgi:hypothetical protein
MDRRDQPAVHAMGGVNQEPGRVTGDEMPKPDEEDDRTQEPGEKDGRTQEPGETDGATQELEKGDVNQHRGTDDARLKLDLDHVRGGTKLTEGSETHAEQRVHEMDDEDLEPDHHETGDGKPKLEHETGGANQDLEEMDACQMHRDDFHHYQALA